MAEQDDHWILFRLQNIAPERFEVLCAALLLAEGHTEVRHRGASGSDGGVDVSSIGPGGEIWATQCKRYKILSATTAVREIRKIIEHPPHPRPKVFHLAATCDVSVKTENALKHEAARAPFPLKVATTWAATELVGLLRDRHLALREDFISPLGRFPAGSSLTTPLQGLLPELLQILQSLTVDAEQIRMIYRQSAPLRWQPLVAVEETDELLARAATSLQLAPRQRDGSRPLLTFVHRLDHQLGHEAPELRAWIERAWAALGVEDEESRRRLLGSEGRPPEEARRVQLLVQIESAEEPGFHHLKAWLKAEKAASLHHAERVSTERLPAEMAHLRLLASRRGLSPGRTEIEVMLPRDLLISAACDQWPLPLEKYPDPVPLGFEYPLVVRFLERAEDPTLMRILAQRWISFLEKKGRATEVAGSVEELTEEHLIVRFGADRISRKLLRLLRQAPGVVGGLLSTPPSAKPGGLDAVALQEGLGILLWVRENEGAATPSELATLEEALARPLEGMRERIFELRQEADEESDLGSRLTLVWDDPTEPFPDFDPLNRFQVPKRRIT